MTVSWNGIYSALTTKFTTDDKLDFALFEKNLMAQLDAGVEGVILGGTLGEASVLSNSEKFDLVKFTADKVAGKVPVVLNIAEGSTREAIKQAADAEKSGATALMMLPPMRYKSDHRETVTFFKTVANTTKLPIMIYNNPIDYKVEVTLDMFAELAEVDNIQAVKESTRDVSNVTRMINRFGDRFKILCGVDTITMEELMLGATGVVAGLVCAFPKETVAMYKLTKAGKIDEALKIYRWFLPMLELDIRPKLVQYIKLAEQEVGLGSEIVRAPRLTLVGEEREQVLKIIRDGIKNRPKL
ncbi:MAG: dihydrodipicolinate synthase family protein [Bacteroidota bacterium]|nr:MAG: Dihydrodipicolinate synthase [Bacteroidetes bacterium OLB12]GIL24687.1 MAG: dihydrodipicolinate synthase family protein [Bacteroidota bacterium]HNR75143.1 dihydrodipicolinate synthase family protein [Cyclobacteriaceae bacterium]HNU42998.1 dihydrodipicolinate synthase family protein [Cyclobacteriaceae bacterium]